MKSPGATANFSRRIELERQPRKEFEGSYHFTQNGALLLSGFQPSITPSGLAGEALQAEILAQASPSDASGDTPTAGLVLSDRDGCYHGVVNGVVTPMSEQVVLLEKLGEGATGVVYRAFDLFNLRLVAVKVIPVRDYNKRRQVVQELSSLHDSLITRRRRASAHAPPPSFSSNGSTYNRYEMAPHRFRCYSWPTISSEAHTAPLDPLDGSEYLLELINVYPTSSSSTLSLVVEYMDGGSLQVRLLFLAGLGSKVAWHVTYSA